VGLQPPGEVVTLLGWLGFSWPEGDETKMYEVGMAWVDLATALDAPLRGAADAARQVWEGNAGDAVSAFQAVWNHERSPGNNLLTAGGANMQIGVAMIACAAVVLALKINVIVQVTLLAIQIAQAVATAVVTFGASLAEIPIFKLITQLIIDQLIGMAIDAILNA
jgi:hypothetical protein